MNKYRERPEEEVCTGCAFLPTKPEAVPDEIIEAVGIALGLAEIERGGGKFDYPSALSPTEWAAVRGLIRGKDRAESFRQERERQERKKKQT